MTTELPSIYEQNLVDKIFTKASNAVDTGKLPFPIALELFSPHLVRLITRTPGRTGAALAEKAGYAPGDTNEVAYLLEAKATALRALAMTFNGQDARHQRAIDYAWRELLGFIAHGVREDVPIWIEAIVQREGLQQLVVDALLAGTALDLLNRKTKSVWPPDTWDDAIAAEAEIIIQKFKDVCNQFAS